MIIKKFNVEMLLLFKEIANLGVGVGVGSDMTYYK